MFTLNSKFLFALIVQGCISMAVIPFTSDAQNKKKDDGKIHIIIKKEENGKEINIDTVFESKDEKAAEEFMKQNNIEGNINQSNRNIVLKFNDDFDTDKLEKEMERAEQKMKEMRFEFNFDSLDKMAYSFKMNMPDEKDMEELKSKMKEMKIEINDLPSLPELPELPDINYDNKGMSKADRKKYEEHIQKANEEIKKALELLKENGK